MILSLDAGFMYSWGWGDAGRLGHNDSKARVSPKKIEGLANVVGIACGSGHSACLTGTFE